MFRAMRAAVDCPVRLDTMPDHGAVTVSATRREGVNCAFKAVEGVTCTVSHHLERFVVVISADFATSHSRVSLIAQRRFGLRPIWYDRCKSNAVNACAPKMTLRTLLSQIVGT
jgi:hypothetical protein